MILKNIKIQLEKFVAKTASQNSCHGKNVKIIITCVMTSKTVTFLKKVSTLSSLTFRRTGKLSMLLEQLLNFARMSIEKICFAAKENAN